MKNFLVCLDGIIGAGKSRILEELKLRGYLTDPEPFQKVPMLERFYADKNRFACNTQMAFLHQRVRQFHRVRNVDGVVVIERSIQSDRWVFGEMLMEAGFDEPENWQDYTEYFDHESRIRLMRPDLCIFIDEDPELALQRIKERGRLMEKDIDLPYLLALREKHLKNIEKLGEEVEVLSFDIENYYALRGGVTERGNDVADIIERGRPAAGKVA